MRTYSSGSGKIRCLVWSRWHIADKLVLQESKWLPSFLDHLGHLAVAFSGLSEWSNICILLLLFQTELELDSQQTLVLALFFNCNLICAGCEQTLGHSLVTLGGGTCCVCFRISCLHPHGFIIYQISNDWIRLLFLRGPQIKPNICTSSCGIKICHFCCGGKAGETRLDTGRTARVWKREVNNLPISWMNVCQ